MAEAEDDVTVKEEVFGILEQCLTDDRAVVRTTACECIGSLLGDSQEVLATLVAEKLAGKIGRAASKQNTIGDARKAAMVAVKLLAKNNLQLVTAAQAAKFAQNLMGPVVGGSAEEASDPQYKYFAERGLYYLFKCKGSLAAASLLNDATAAAEGEVQQFLKMYGKRKLPGSDEIDSDSEI